MALFLDFDSPKSAPSRKFIRWIVTGLCGIQIQTIYYKSTQRGKHVIIRVNEKLQPLELVALQAILGSDSMREALNFMRARWIHKLSPEDYWRSRWNIIYDFKVSE